MQFKTLVSVLAFAIVAMASTSESAFAAKTGKSLFLVVGENGAGFTDPQVGVNMMSNLVVPGLEQMAKWTAEKKILAGGIYAGGRAGAMIVEADSVDEVDRLIHSIALWPLLDWKVTALQSFETRLGMERENLAMLKKMLTK